MNDCAVSRETGIPRKTVWEWRRDREYGHATRPAHRTAASTTTSRLPAAPYSYLPALPWRRLHLTTPAEFHLALLRYELPAIIAAVGNPSTH